MVEENRQKMGVGKLGSVDNIFPRRFRFTIESNILEDMYSYVQKLQVNLGTKQLRIHIMEVIDSRDFAQDLDDWIRHFDENPNELTLMTFSGCGLPLYEIKFLGLKRIGHKMSTFDYASSDISTQIVTIEFEDYIRTSHKGNKYAKLEESSDQSGAT